MENFNKQLPHKKILVLLINIQYFSKSETIPKSNQHLLAELNKNTTNLNKNFYVLHMHNTLNLPLVRLCYSLINTIYVLLLNIQVFDKTDINFKADILLELSSIKNDFEQLIT